MILHPREIFPKNFPRWFFHRLKIYLAIALLTAQLFLGVAGFDSSGKFILPLIAIELSFFVPLKIERPSLQWLRRGNVWGVVTASFVLVFVASGLVKSSFTELTQLPEGHPIGNNIGRPELWETPGPTPPGNDAIGPGGPSANPSATVPPQPPDSMPAQKLAPQISADAPITKLKPARRPVNPPAKADRRKPDVLTSPQSQDDSAQETLNRLRQQKSRPVQDASKLDPPPIYPILSSSEVGLVAQTILPQRANELELPPGAGLEINGVVVGSRANKAGLRPGDVILKIGGEAPTDLSLIAKVARRTPPGQAVSLELLRKGQQITAHLDVDQLRK